MLQPLHPVIISFPVQFCRLLAGLGQVCAETCLGGPCVAVGRVGSVQITTVNVVALRTNPFVELPMDLRGFPLFL